MNTVSFTNEKAEQKWFLEFTGKASDATYGVYMSEHCLGQHNSMLSARLPMEFVLRE